MNQLLLTHASLRAGFALLEQDTDPAAGSQRPGQTVPSRPAPPSSPRLHPRLPANSLPRSTIEAPIVGLLDVSDKELHTIFTNLSQTPHLLDRGAVPLSRTCRRLDVFYRLDYVNAFDRDLVLPAQTEHVSTQADAVTRALLRLPTVSSMTVDVELWHALRVRHPVPAHITKLTLCLHSLRRSGDPGAVAVDDELAALPGVLPALLQLSVVDVFGECKMTRAGFAGIASLSSLQAIELDSSHEDGAVVVPMLLRLPRLRRLWLTNFKFDAALVEGLPRGFEELRFVIMFLDGWTGIFLPLICGLPNLRRLNLLATDVVVAGDWYVLEPAAARLEYLALDSFHLSDSSDNACFRTMSAMTNLKSLILINTCGSYDEVLRAAATLPMLETLYIHSDHFATEGSTECGVSHSGLVALRNGRAKRSLNSLCLHFPVWSFEERDSLDKLCLELFTPEPDLPCVGFKLDLNFYSSVDA